MTTQDTNYWKLAGRTVALIIGCLITFAAVISFVDWRVKSVVEGDEYIRKVASHVRPYVIFDAEERILVDGGAMQYLDAIEVRGNDEQGSSLRDLTIVVTSKIHLLQAPLIERVAAPGTDIIGERGKGYQWVYKFGVGWRIGGEAAVPRFRLEILR